MTLAVQKLVSLITAAVVLVSSVTCFCGAASAVCRDVTIAGGDGDRDCCRGDADHDDDCHDAGERGHERDGPTEHQCPHCTATLNAGDVGSHQDVAPVLVLLPVSAVFHSPGFLSSLTDRPTPAPKDRPPPGDPPTLLNLCCSLTI